MPGIKPGPPKDEADTAASSQRVPPSLRPLKSTSIAWDITLSYNPYSFLSTHLSNSHGLPTVMEKNGKWKSRRNYSSETVMEKVWS